MAVRCSEEQVCSKKGNSYTCWWLIYTFPLLLLLLSFSLSLSLGLHFLRSFALNIPSHLSLSLVRLDTVPYSTPLPVSPVPQGDTFYIFSAYPYFSAVTEFLPLDHRRSLSVCRCFLAHGWDSSTRERKCVCVCVRKRGRQKEKEREKLPIMFPLWVSVCLLLSVAFSEPQYHVVLINFPGSVLKTPHSASPLHINKRSFACMRLCLCVCRYEI